LHVDGHDIADNTGCQRALDENAYEEGPADLRQDPAIEDCEQNVSVRLLKQKHMEHVFSLKPEEDDDSSHEYIIKEKRSDPVIRHFETVNFHDFNKSFFFLVNNIE
jgi:hypothetical protein